jgi:hypothetical protein
MNQLFILGAYVIPPLVRESRLVRDLTMPHRDWSKYELPSYERNPGFIAHSRERHSKRKVWASVSYLRAQA